MSPTRRLRGERGDATVEAVLAVPVLLVLIMIIIQFGLYYQAASTAQAAAREGVRAARVEGASADDGQRRAEAFMATAAPTLVDHVTVVATRDATAAHVEVRGTVHSLLPGVTLTIHTTAASPIEVFRPDTP